MSRSHSPEQACTAAQLAAELAGYEAGLQDLLQGHWDPDLYRNLSDAFDRMQLLATGLPRLGYGWTELLISRVELTHALWSVREPARVNGKVVALHERHRALLRGLRQECEGYAAPGGHVH